MSNPDPPFLPVAGLRLAAGAAGIRYRGRDDLVLVELREGTDCAAVYTRNAFCAAPVTLARSHLSAKAPRWWLINAGNANAGTGARGLTDAAATCRALADLAGVSPEQVLPFSTGVIGEPLPVERISAALPGLIAGLDPAGWSRAARAIMTTDRVPKLVSRRFELDGHTATLTGMAKGAGMICPDMATMLAFLATDAAVEPGVLQQLLRTAVDHSFNAVTVDGDTSTNDACVLAATGALGNPPVADLLAPGGTALQAALDALCLDLATAIVRDAEGATKL
ncbi:MAG: bifunctional ornithine acetyltransferase/N-acetylglutamate synthase, partial [Chromatiaceae bacterium]|nr:bifunctional ornithine acetyltransferase/N-acetylglutamate synthase [Chromatiaceae bacterium]